MKIGLFQVCDKDRYTAKLFGPLGLSYISSYLKEYGGYDDIFIERDLENLITKKPDVVGISSYTETFMETCNIATVIKSRLDIPIILGGHHITGIPESLPPQIDAGVIGEGEEIFLDLIKSLEKDSLENLNFSGFSGIVYHENGIPKVTHRKKELIEVDKIPKPDRRLLEQLSPNFEPLLHTSRGCPYTCSFCSVFSRKVRFHSPERVVEEIIDIKRKYPNKKFIHISDDIFALKNKRLFRLVELVKQEKLDKEFIFTCHARANIFDRELGLLLKDMNVKYVSFGFESGSENIVREVKGKFNLNDNKKALDICEELNLNVNGYFIAGYPMETKADFAKTYWFISNNRERISRISLTQLTPLPGTDMWDYGLKAGVVNDVETNWNNLDFGFSSTNEKMFFNEHYSFDFFQENFNKLRDLQDYFNSINSGAVEKNGFLGKNNVPGKEGQSNYNQSVYSRIIKLIPVNASKILEISPNYFELDKHIPDGATLISQKPDKDLTEIGDNFDFIILNHTLEQVKNPEHFMKKLSPKLSPNGKILLFVYNTQFIEILGDLITDSWGFSSYGLEQRKNINYFSIERLNEIFNQANLEIEDEIEISLRSEKYQYNEILSLISKYLKFDLQSLSAYSFVITLTKQCTPVT